VERPCITYAPRIVLPTIPAWSWPESAEKLAVVEEVDPQHLGDREHPLGMAHLLHDLVLETRLERARGSPRRVRVKTGPRGSGCRSTETRGTAGRPSGEASAMTING